VDIRSLLLDTDNGLEYDGRTIGRRIGEAGAACLWEPRRGDTIDTVVIHYTSAVGVSPETPYALGAILSVFCVYGVSSHYLIQRDGAVVRLVPEEQKAWHCGGSIMPPPDNRTGVNDFSIGIELASTVDASFTDAQYAGLAALCRDIERRRGSMRYVGHEHIAGNRAVALGLRSEPKEDPGRFFDWKRFARERTGG
jgi:N-acetyl-anhydromuramyl-L-alanine amidase AmpD